MSIGYTTTVINLDICFPCFCLWLVICVAPITRRRLIWKLTSPLVPPIHRTCSRVFLLDVFIEICECYLYQNIQEIVENMYMSDLMSIHIHKYHGEGQQIGQIGSRDDNDPSVPACRADLTL